jgi:hypothetical protein
VRIRFYGCFSSQAARDTEHFAAAWTIFLAALTSAMR